MAPRHPSPVAAPRCPQCSETIPSEAPEGLCPCCLFRMAVTAPRDPIGGAEADVDDNTSAADAGDEAFDTPRFGFAETPDAALRRLTAFKTAAARYLPAPPDHTLSLDARFNRAWALNVLELALRRVRLDWVSAGRGDEFHRLKYALVSDWTEEGQPSAREHGPTRTPAVGTRSMRASSTISRRCPASRRSA